MFNKTVDQGVLPLFLSCKICDDGNEVKERLEDQIYPDDVYSIFIMLNGSMNAEEKNKHFTLDEGGWHVHKGGFLHVKEFSAKYKFCCIMFSVQDDAMLMNAINEDGKWICGAKKTESIVYKLVECNQNKESDIFALNGTLYQLIEALKECSNKVNVSDNLAERIKLYINTHYAESINNELLSQIFFYAPSYLNNCFVSHYKTTIHKYQTALRLEKAMELLKQDDLTLTGIALKVGYYDYSTFYRSFFKEYKQSPQELVNKLKNK